MSARKWPYYTMAVGEHFFVFNPPKSFPVKVRQYAAENGKRFQVRRWDRNDPLVLVVRRIK
jgi:hypothetical protein